MRPDRSNFYVKLVKAFIDVRPGKKLRDRSAEDIRSFLEIAVFQRCQAGITSGTIQTAIGNHVIPLKNEPLIFASSTI